MARNPFVADYGGLTQSMQFMVEMRARNQRAQLEKEMHRQRMEMMQRRLDAQELEARRAREADDLKRRQAMGAAQQEIYAEQERRRAAGDDAKTINSIGAAIGKAKMLPPEMIPKWKPMDGDRYEVRGFGDEPVAVRDPRARKLEQDQARAAVAAVVQGQDPVAQGLLPPHEQRQFAAYGEGSMQIQPGMVPMPDMGAIPDVPTDVPTATYQQALNRGVPADELIKLRMFQLEEEGRNSRAILDARARMAAVGKQLDAKPPPVDPRVKIMAGLLSKEEQTQRELRKALTPKTATTTTSTTEDLLGPKKTESRRVPEALPKEKRDKLLERLKESEDRARELREDISIMMAGGQPRNVGGGRRKKKDPVAKPEPTDDNAVVKVMLSNGSTAEVKARALQDPDFVAKKGIVGLANE